MGSKNNYKKNIFLMVILLMIFLIFKSIDVFNSIYYISEGETRLASSIGIIKWIDNHSELYLFCKNFTSKKNKDFFIQEILSSRIKILCNQNIDLVENDFMYLKLRLNDDFIGNKYPYIIHIEGANYNNENECVLNIHFMSDFNCDGSTLYIKHEVIVNNNNGFIKLRHNELLNYGFDQLKRSRSILSR